MNSRAVRVGFDIGGTFTDLVLHDRARDVFLAHKVLTTPDDPAEGAIGGLRELVALAGLAVADIGELVHGTTLVTNAIIEGKGAKTALLTTAGFRDVLELGIEQRYDIYDLFLKFPSPLVPRDLRLEIPERVDRDGHVVVELDRRAVRETLARCRDQGVEAVAVCFINAYRNPAHERVVGEIARSEFPDLAVSLSSAVVSEIREYHRCATTCANAFVQPLVQRYLDRIAAALDGLGFAGTFRMMHSAAGLVSPEVAAGFPIRLLESGPAGGCLASALFAERASRPDILAFDMGGTTAKTCLVENGRIAVAAEMEAARAERFARGSGIPIEAPVVDMIEIGAGGGSIVWIDELGLLKVGPQSAGSAPGPACYGAGGLRPTVTDANLVLGYYDPDSFLGGRMKLDRDAAVTAIETVAAPLGLSVEEAAMGVNRLANENMASAARIHLVEKGRDARRFAMIAFGGAGPAHAAEVARTLGIAEVIVPPASGAASALGFLAAPLSFEVARSHIVEIAPGFDDGEVEALLAAAEEEATARLLSAGVGAADIKVERSVDMRLVGQSHAVNVPLGSLRVDDVSLPAIRARFDEVYAERFVAPYPGARVEAIAFRVGCTGPKPAVDGLGVLSRPADAAKIKGRRRARFEDGVHEAAVYDRYALSAGDRIEGPAIVEEHESTTVVGPGDSILVDDGRNLVISVAGRRAAPPAAAPGGSLEERTARIESDPVALELMWARLVNVAEEMWHTVCRTAFSLVISEAQDFACDLLDVNGDTLAHSARAMPVFNLTLPRAVKALLAEFPVATLRPGDVLLTNDPWFCAGHLFDLVAVTPVFAGDRVVALAATVGNVVDIGGTKDFLRAREIYEEGFQIPPMKVFSAGRPDETFFRLFEKNVRLADQVIGDLHSLIAANALGARRLLEFMEDYGLRDLEALSAVIGRRAERAMREAIAALPDGTFAAEIRSNPRGNPIRYDVALTIAGDTLALGFANAPPQIGEGGFNCTLNYTQATASYPLKCILTPNVRGNGGCFAPMTITAPEGTVLNAAYPAPVNFRSRIGWYFSPGIFRALAEAAPDRVRAATGLPLTSPIHGRNEDGTLYADILFTGGGQGGGAGADGRAGLIWPSSAANTSVEMLESRVPILVMEKSLVADSGGPGEFRGGPGQRIVLRKLHDDGLPTFVSVVPEGADNPIEGLFGGRPGGMAGARLLDDEGRVLEDFGKGALARLDNTRQFLEILVAGGAGYGDPRRRPDAAIEADLRLGLVTPAGVRRDYGRQHAPELEGSDA